MAAGELYGRTGPDQHALTVFARLGGYSGESQGEAWFANLSLKKVTAVPEGAEIALFYQPDLTVSQGEARFDLRHGLLALLVLMYLGLAGSCFRARSLLGLTLLSLGMAAVCLFFQGAGAGDAAEALYQRDASMPYVPSIMYGLLLATLLATLLLAHDLARKGEAIPRFGGRKPEDTSAELFLGDERANHQRSRRVGGKDVAWMLGITALYALVAYHHLGSTVSPQTSFTFTQTGEQVVFDLGSPQEDFRMLYMGGVHQSSRSFTVQLSADGEIWGTPVTCSMEPGSLFQWHEVSGAGACSGRYVRLTAAVPGLTLLETIFRDADGTPLPVTVTDSAGRDASALVDEPDTLVGEPSWYNGMYFDEIYHARTAYEHLHGMQPYEVTHPPLGKVLMSWAIAALGMTPFGWRFAGATCGVLMLPGMYLVGRLLFAKRRYAILTCLCLALDTLHLTQTRIATIDSFVVLFIIWAVYFMLRWFYVDFFGQSLAARWFRWGCPGSVWDWPSPASGRAALREWGWRRFSSWAFGGDGGPSGRRRPWRPPGRTAWPLRRRKTGTSAFGSPWPAA